MLPIELDRRRLDELYQSFLAHQQETDQAGGTVDLPDELRFRSYLTAQVNRIVPNWIEELAADLFGLCALGPAYLHAFIHFSISFQLLDDASGTHPPARLRLRVLFRLLAELYGPLPSEHEGDRSPFSIETEAFLQCWRNIADQEPTDMGLFETLALETVEQAAVLDGLQQGVLRGIKKENLYDRRQFEQDLAALVPMIEAHVPPIEFPNGGKGRIPTLAGILNAGWECYLGRLERFKQVLPNAAVLSPLEVRRAFNGFILKSLELNDVVRTWKQVQP